MIDFKALSNTSGLKNLKVMGSFKAIDVTLCLFVWFFRHEYSKNLHQQWCH